MAHLFPVLDLSGGFYVHDPGVAETLDMSDEGETLASLPEKIGSFTLVARARYQKPTVSAYLRLAEQDGDPRPGQARLTLTPAETDFRSLPSPRHLHFGGVSLGE